MKVKLLRWFYNSICLISLALVTTSIGATEDKRQWVKMPERMQQHMMSNMRDHLLAIHEILAFMEIGQLDRAAEVAELRLGMSALEQHDARHMAGFMPEGMRKAGTSMHRAASAFALKAQEGEPLSAYRALSAITASCVTCHAAYRIHRY